MRDNSKSVLEKVWMVVKKNVLVSATLLFVVVLIVVTFLIVGISGIRDNIQRKKAYDALSDQEKALLEQDFTLAKDAYEDVNTAMAAYLNALANNDQDYLKENVYRITGNEFDNIEVKSKYTDHVDNIVCYTQNGFAEESYYVYVTYDSYFTGFDIAVPSIIGLYYAKDENGAYKIYRNDKDEMPVEVRENFYIAYMQQDVQDIYNQVSLSYNETLDKDEKLKDFMLGYEEMIKNDLVALNEERDRLEREAQANQENQDDQGPVRETVKATTSVNVRSSDSETAERLGTVSEGSTLVRLEAKRNGWSRVEYEGKEAYIKSQYLQVVDDEGNVVEDNNNDTQVANNDNNNNNNNDNSTTKKYVTAIDNVNIRSEADIDSERVGFAYNGEKFEVVEQLSNGWTKIKYNGKDCYVKSDYVQ